MTVYLVTCGEYERYSVAAAFSSREEAQPYADYLIAKEESAVVIEEFELDIKKPKPLKRIFYCQLYTVLDGLFASGSAVGDADEPLTEDSPHCFYSYESAQDARAKAEKRRGEYLRDNPERAIAPHSERDWRSDLTTC